MRELPGPLPLQPTHRTCARCGTTAPLHFVACPNCFALFFAEELSALSKEADALEKSGDLVGALEKWRAMEPMLPRASTQATAIHTRIAALEAKAGAAGARPKAAQGKGWLAGLGALIVAVATKAKFLLFGLAKLPTLLTFFASATLWQGASGPGFALVVLGSVYVHEMGHTFAFRRYGIAVTPPMFVPGFGAFVRGSHYPKSLTAIGDVALSGPLWGGVSGVLTLAIGLALEQQWLVGAAVIIAEINLFNLIPVWQLDGSRASATLSRAQLPWLGIAALALGLMATSPMAMITGGGLILRRWFGAPPETQEGDRRTFVLFLALIVGLLALRIGANFFVAPTTAH
ncbi:MAG: site-2 protease family protein [Archangium sp.]|nr:site-2 protease family protein [Archangium sp.]